MFDLDQFVADCRSAHAADRSSKTISDVVKLVVSDPAAPTSKFTTAIHVYGGDFFAAQRSEWDPETLSEQSSDGERARQIFEEANRRYAAGLS